MNMRIRNFLDRHPIIDYFQKVLRYANNSEFRNSVLKLYNSPDFLELFSYGEENKGKGEKYDSKRCSVFGCSIFR